MATNQPLLQPPKSPPSKTLPKIPCFSAVLFCSAIFTTNKFIESNPSQNDHHPFLHSICHKAYNPSSCIQMALSEFQFHPQTNPKFAPHFFQSFLKNSTTKLINTIQTATDLRRRINDQCGKAALADCIELMEISIDRITDSISGMQNRATGSMDNAHTWLSSVLTNHVTCSDEINSSIPESAMELGLEELIERGRNSLGMLVSIWGVEIEEIEKWGNGYPNWLKIGDRRLLEVVGREMEADIVVVKDGSGRFSMVAEAVPDKSKNRRKWPKISAHARCFYNV